VGTLSFTPDGRLMAVNSEEVELWDVSEGKLQQKLTLPDMVSAAALAHDGRHLAVGNLDGTIYLLRLAGK